MQYTLYINRVMASEAVEVPVGTYDTLEQCTYPLYSGGFWLSAFVIDTNGQRYKLVELPDVDDKDYITFMFTPEQ